MPDYTDLETLYGGLEPVVREIVALRQNPPGALADVRAFVRQTIDMRLLHKPFYPIDDRLAHAREDEIAFLLRGARAALEEQGLPLGVFDAAAERWLRADDPVPEPRAAVTPADRPWWIPPQTTEDPSVSPLDGGPWTTHHAAIVERLESRAADARSGVTDGPGAAQAPPRDQDNAAGPPSSVETVLALGVAKAHVDQGLELPDAGDRAFPPVPLSAPAEV